jgi:hypothetical protein
MAFVEELGVDRLGLLTHDVGDTLGGELLARQLEGPGVEITDRTADQRKHLLSTSPNSVPASGSCSICPTSGCTEDTPSTRPTVMAGVTATFSPASPVDPEEIAAQWEMIAHLDGPLLLPRLIRYIDERGHEAASPGPSNDTRPPSPWCGEPTTPSPCRP